MTERGSGDYYGHPTLRLANDRVWLDVLAGGGPRIVRLGADGGANLFAETPKAGWDTPSGRYELLGGHRLWYAPETLDPSVPDTSNGLQPEPIEDGVRLVGPRESTGLRRVMTVHLYDGRPVVGVEHEIRNEGGQTFELAAWGITQVPLGGVAVAPEPPEVPGHDVTPNRLHVVWPYTSWHDDRLEVGSGLVAVRTRSGQPFKIGLLSRDGAVGFLRDGVLLVIRFDPQLDARHTDLGSNLQVYCDDQTVELETVGPFGRLGPGETARHDERWEVYDASGSAPESDAVQALVLGRVEARGAGA